MIFCVWALMFVCMQLCVNHVHLFVEARRQPQIWLLRPCPPSIFFNHGTSRFSFLRTSLTTYEKQEPGCTPEALDFIHIPLAMASVVFSTETTPQSPSPSCSLSYRFWLVCPTVLNNLSIFHSCHLPPILSFVTLSVILLSLLEPAFS